MVKGCLPDRPVGVRKSWKLATTNAALVSVRLTERSPLVRPQWGEPIAGQEWRERKGALRRLIATYADGRVVSMSFRRNGRTILTIRGGNG